MSNYPLQLKLGIGAMVLGVASMFYSISFENRYLRLIEEEKYLISVTQKYSLTESELEEITNRVESIRNSQDYSSQKEQNKKQEEQTPIRKASSCLGIALFVLGALKTYKEMGKEEQIN